MGVERMAVVANAVRDEQDDRAVRSMLAEHGLPLLFSLPLSEVVSRADIEGRSVFQMEAADQWLGPVGQLSKEILTLLGDASGPG